MHKWILVILLSILSSILLTSITTSKVFIIQTSICFNTQIETIILMNNMLNYFFILFGIIILPWLNKYLIIFLEAGLFLTVFTSLGFYVIGDYFIGYVFLVPLQAMAYALIIATPFGFINLFRKNLRIYVTSLLLFLPKLLSNICILYGKTNIYYSYPIRDHQKIHQQRNRLNLILALLSIKCSMVVIYLMRGTLHNVIKKMNKRKEKDIKGEGVINSYIIKFKKQFQKFDKQLVASFGCWGFIIGVILAYGNQQMVEIFFGQTKTHKSPQFYTQTELMAHIISFILTNFFTSLCFQFNFRQTKITNSQIVFFLNIVGLLANIFIQANLILPFSFLNNKFCIIGALIISKIGLYYSAIFIIAQLSYYGNLIIMAFGLIFVSNIVQIYILEMLNRLNDSKIFIYIAFSIWGCIFLVQKLRDSENYHYGFKNLLIYEPNQTQNQQQDRFIQQI